MVVTLPPPLGRTEVTHESAEDSGPLVWTISQTDLKPSEESLVLPEHVRLVERLHDPVSGAIGMYRSHTSGNYDAGGGSVIERDFCKRDEDRFAYAAA
jgi:hypothetical protein